MNFSGDQKWKVWFDSRFEREGARARAPVRVTLCARDTVCRAHWLQERVERRAKRDDETRRDERCVGRKEKRTEGVEDRRGGGGGGGSRSGEGVGEQVGVFGPELCSRTVVPCTQPNNRDQPSLMCT